MRFFLATLAFLASTGIARAGDDPLAPLGSNINSVNDFSDEFPFVNLMKTSRDWIPGQVGCFDCRDNPSSGGTCPAFVDLAPDCQQDGVPGNGIACEIDPNTFNIPAPAGSGKSNFVLDDISIDCTASGN